MSGFYYCPCSDVNRHLPVGGWDNFYIISSFFTAKLVNCAKLLHQNKANPVLHQTQLCNMLEVQVQKYKTREIADNSFDYRTLIACVGDFVLTTVVVCILVNMYLDLFKFAIVALQIS